MLDPQGQQSLLRLVGSAYGGVKMAKELVPDMAGLRPPIDASFAKMENSVMALGQPPSFEPNQNHAVHIEQHLARVDELSQMLSNGEIDITEAYQAARRTVFATCRRIELPVRPGEATLLHRLALHGVAAWKPDDTAPPEGRMIAYLRPLLPSVETWLKRA
jgi:hypothetical protein